MSPDNVKRFKLVKKGENLDYTGTVKQYIVDNFLFGDANHLNNDTSFLENGIIDSTGVLELVAFLENTFDLKIEDHELIPENLDSINNINRYLKSKTQPPV